MSRTVLIVGSSGIQGQAASDAFAADGWTVYGLARHPVEREGVTPVAADLLEPEALRKAVSGLKPEIVVLTTWQKRETEEENIAVNGAMVRNLLKAVAPEGTVKHVALVTGLKHYLGPFENYAKGEPPKTPIRESQGRVDAPNFYYAQEDEVFAAAERDGFSWSVHRSHTIVGKAVGNAMNMGQTLAVFATICRETGRPFRFPGSKVQWESLTDVTDARQLADQLVWAAKTPAAANEDFNVVNGDVFRWQWMWSRIADWFGIEPVDFDGEHVPLEGQMKGDAQVWAKIAERYDLAERDLDKLASPWHTDADLGRPIEVVTDISKSRKLGFAGYRASDDSFLELFEELRADRIIPDCRD